MPQGKLQPSHPLSHPVRADCATAATARDFLESPNQVRLPLPPLLLAPFPLQCKHLSSSPTPPLTLSSRSCLQVQERWTCPLSPVDLGVGEPQGCFSSAQAECFGKQQVVLDTDNNWTMSGSLPSSTCSQITGDTGVWIGSKSMEACHQCCPQLTWKQRKPQVHSCSTPAKGCRDQVYWVPGWWQ